MADNNRTRNRNRADRTNAFDETGIAHLAAKLLAEDVARAHTAAGGLDWLDDAACADEDLATFFPQSGQHAGAARKVCGGCPVLDRCQAYTNEIGVFFVPTTGFIAGESSNERTLRRRQEKKDAAAAA